MNEEKKEPSPPTLTKWIQENHNLISTLAIFATLSAFANNLPDKDQGRLLSFLLFALALSVGFEILLKFPPVQQGRLYWFGEIFAVSILLFAYVWVATYYPYLTFFLFMAAGLVVVTVIFIFLQMAIRRTVSRISWLKGKSQRTREELIPLFGSMLLMTLSTLVLGHPKFLRALWQIISKGR
ncbi:MAG: hypothetical protein ABSH01_10885 [Terriglobia bacterium]|jgi:hypothetical protein